MFELHLNNLHSLSVSLLIIAGFDLFFAVIAFGRRKAVGGGIFSASYAGNEYLRRRICF